MEQKLIGETSGGVTTPSSRGGGQSHPPVGVAFLLAQLGAYAAEQFAVRIASLDLTPAQVGLLRALSVMPGQSQQALARHLRTQPSRVVTLVDELEGRGLVERLPDLQDRRRYALQLSALGRELVQQVGQVARQHEEAMDVPLDHAERQQLMALLERLQRYHGLTTGVHPGYRQLGDGEPTRRSGKPC